MKRFLKIIAGLVTGGFLSISSVLAAVDSFNVTMAPQSVSIWESVDLVVEAVDANNAVVTDYDGTILMFSESDMDAKLPSVLDQNTYWFTAADQWVVKFENAVSFSKEGLQDIYIYDLNNDTVIGVGEITVTGSQEAEVIEIEILSPENGLTIWENEVNISGKTQKNHKVEIVVNDLEPIEVISNNNGDFETVITTLVNGNNAINAFVLNADDQRVGESNMVEIKVESIAPSFKSVKSSPDEVETGWEFTVEVIATKELTNVSVVVNDVVEPLEETTDGIYTAKLFAPNQSGTFKIDVILKDELGLETKELGAGSITVFEKEEVKAEPTEPLPAAGDPVEEKPDYTIKNIKVTQLKSKSVVTWDEIDGIEGYEVYKKISDTQNEKITDVSEPRFEIEITGEEIKYDYFAIKPIVKTASGELVPSEEIPYSEMTKVQTGPEMIILLLISLLVGGFMFMNKQRNA